MGDKRCPICRAVVSNIGTHVRNQHKDTTLERLNQSRGDKWTQCRHCKNFFQSQQGLNYHLNGHCRTLNRELAGDRLDEAGGAPPTRQANILVGAEVEETYDVQDLMDLTASFQNGLYRINHTWKTPIREIVRKCLPEVTNENAVDALAALGLLFCQGL